jgi:hypothetical protein
MAQDMVTFYRMPRPANYPANINRQILALPISATSMGVACFVVASAPADWSCTLDTIREKFPSLTENDLRNAVGELKTYGILKAIRSQPGTFAIHDQIEEV